MMTKNQKSIKKIGSSLTHNCSEEIVVTEIKILASSSKQQQLNAFSQLKFLAKHVKDYEWV